MLNPDGSLGLERIVGGGIPKEDAEGFIKLMKELDMSDEDIEQNMKNHEARWQAQKVEKPQERYKLYITDEDLSNWVKALREAGLDGDFIYDFLNHVSESYAADTRQRIIDRSKIDLKKIDEIMIADAVQKNPEITDDEIKKLKDKFRKADKIYESFVWSTDDI